MTKNIAVICALPPERNTGMATVDLSAQRVLQRLHPDARITLYTYGKASKHGYQPGDLPYEHLDITDHAQAFFAADAYVYWGDFLHARSYWEKDRGEWGANVGAAQKLAMRRECADFMFLASLRDEELKKAIVFGSTIITNDAVDKLDNDYTPHFMRFFRHAGRVFFRDALSAAKIAPLRTDEATLGCDCALLLEATDLATLKDFTPAQQRQGVGIFLGRSCSKLTMLLFARKIAQELGEPCRWIPWFWTRLRLRLLGKSLGLTINRGTVATGDILSQLSQCKFVVTDTYHLCVNAWAMGIPAICIGTGAAVSAHSLSDKKKEIFCEMYGARRFYVFLEALTLLNLPARARDAAAALSNEALCQQVVANIAAHRVSALSRLKQALENVLTRA